MAITLPAPEDLALRVDVRQDVQRVFARIVLTNFVDSCPLAIARPDCQCRGSTAHRVEELVGATTGYRNDRGRGYSRSNQTEDSAFDKFTPGRVRKSPSLSTWQNVIPSHCTASVYDRFRLLGQVSLIKHACL